MRKKYTGSFNAKIVLEILKEEKPAMKLQLSMAFTLTSLQGGKEAINDLAEVLENGRRKGEQKKEALEKQT